jgi:hypothetical protein
MGCLFSRSSDNENEELKRRNDLLEKQIEKQDKMLQILVLNVRMIINTLSPHIDDKQVVQNLNNLLDQQEKIIKQDKPEGNDFF